MVLENSEIETSHSRNVCIIESVLEQTLQWSSLAILNFLSSFLVMIILCNILNKNCLSLLSFVIWYRGVMEPGRRHPFYACLLA